MERVDVCPADEFISKSIIKLAGSIQFWYGPKSPNKPNPGVNTGSAEIEDWAGILAIRSMALRCEFP
jgi:hypothetical protein